MAQKFTISPLSLLAVLLLAITFPHTKVLAVTCCDNCDFHRTIECSPHCKDPNCLVRCEVNWRICRNKCGCPIDKIKKENLKREKTVSK